MKPKLSKSEAARLNGKKGGRPRKPRDPAAVRTVSETPPPPEKPKEPTLDNPFDLDPKELLFVEAYCGPANFVATKAYDLAGYTGTGKGRRNNAAQVLARTGVQKAIAARLAVKVERLRIADDDEVLERVTQRARADIRRLLPDGDSLKNMPDEVAVTVKTLRPGRYGRTIELYDAASADELLLKVSGKLTQKHEVKLTRSLEDILAEVNALERERVSA